MDKPKPDIVVVKEKRFKALKPSQIVNKQRVIYDFDGRFLASFGKPERHAKWFITGPSFSGKSSFIFILVEYLTKFAMVAYNSYEEGDAQTVADKITRHGIGDEKVRFLPGEPIMAFKKRLLAPRGANIGVIDSVQHAEIKKKIYNDLVKSLCNYRRGKGMIFINHWVKDDLTVHVRHDCDIKIEVIGFIAHVESRFGGNKPFVIWEGNANEGAKKYWGKKYKAVIDGKYWPGQKK